MKTKQKPSKMSVDEVQAVRDQTDELEQVLQNADGLNTRPQSPSGIQRKVETNRAILARDELLVAKGRQKDAVAREIRDLEERINRDRPTRRMMNTQPGTREFDEAVQANLAFHKKHTQNMLRLKDLKRRLEPENPFAGDLERIRPD